MLGPHASALVLVLLGSIATGALVGACGGSDPPAPQRGSGSEADLASLPEPLVGADTREPPRFRAEQLEPLTVGEIWALGVRHFDWDEDGPPEDAEREELIEQFLLDAKWWNTGCDLGSDLGYLGE